MALRQFGTPEEDAKEDDLDTRNLTPPPMEKLTLLHKSAMIGDMEAIVSQAVGIEGLDDRYGPFTRQLRRLAEAFED